MEKHSFVYRIVLFSLIYFAIMVQGDDADLTTFESYPTSSSECQQFNGCAYPGQFEFVDGQQTEEWVQQHNIVAIHEKDADTYKLKTLRITQGDSTIDAVVYDECKDSDCDGCCTKNSQNTGFLIDMEKYTMQRFGPSDGVVQWECIDC